MYIVYTSPIVLQLIGGLGGKFETHPHNLSGRIVTIVFLVAVLRKLQRDEGEGITVAEKKMFIVLLPNTAAMVQTYLYTYILTFLFLF